MGASKKLDPDLDIDHVDDNRVTSGSKAGLRSFKDVPPEKGASDAGFELSNEEIAESVNTTATKSPAPRGAQTEGSTGPAGMSGGATSRKRVPAPGTAVDVPKGTLVRGKPSTGDQKPPKRSARAEGSVERAVILNPFHSSSRTPQAIRDRSTSEARQPSPFSGEDFSNSICRRSRILLCSSGMTPMTPPHSCLNGRWSDMQPSSRFMDCSAEPAVTT